MQGIANVRESQVSQTLPIFNHMNTYICRYVIRGR